MKLIILDIFILVNAIINGGSTLADSSTMAALTMSTDKILMWDWSNNSILYSSGPSFNSYPKILKDGRVAWQTNSATLNILNLTSGKNDVILNCSSFAIDEMYNGLLATADLSLQVWNISSNSPLVKTIPSSSFIYLIKQLVFNNFLAVGDLNGGLFIYDPVNNFTLNKNLIGHSDTVWGIDELPNGNIVSCSFDTTVKLWNMTIGICLRTLNPFSNIIYSIKMISPNTLILGGVNDSIYIYKVTSENMLVLNSTISLASSSTSINEIQVTNTNFVIIAFNDGMVGVYNRNNMALIKLHVIGISFGNVLYFSVANRYSVYDDLYPSSTAVAYQTTEMTKTTMISISIWKVLVDYTMGPSDAIGSSFYMKNRPKCLMTCAINPWCKAATYDKNQNCTNFMAYPSSNRETLSFLKSSNLYYKF